MMDVKSTKLDLSKTSKDRTVYTMMINMTILTKTLDNLRGDIKETEEARIKKD